MMTQSEINALVNKINAGTYMLDDALADIASAAKGRDVRAAIYALAYLTGGIGDNIDGNSELLDIRKGADGTVYQSAGEAVRAQVSELKSDLSKKVSLPVTDDGNVDHGTLGQFAVSDGYGGVTWVDIGDGNEVEY